MCSSFLDTAAVRLPLFEFTTMQTIFFFVMSLVLFFPFAFLIPPEFPRNLSAPLFLGFFLAFRHVARRIFNIVNTRKLLLIHDPLSHLKELINPSGYSFITLIL